MPLSVGDVVGRVERPAGRGGPKSHLVAARRDLPLEQGPEPVAIAILSERLIRRAGGLEPDLERARGSVEREGSDLVDLQTAVAHRGVGVVGQRALNALRVATEVRTDQAITGGVGRRRTCVIEPVVGERCRSEDGRAVGRRVARGCHRGARGAGPDPEVIHGGHRERVRDAALQAGHDHRLRRSRHKDGLGFCAALVRGDQVAGHRGRVGHGVPRNGRLICAGDPADTARLRCSRLAVAAG